MLYFLSAGLFGATMLGGGAAVAKTAKPARRTKPAKAAPKKAQTPTTLPRGKTPTTPVTPIATTKVPTTTVAPTSTTTPAGGATSGTVDPWTLYPKTVKATRSATELIVESTGLPEHLMMIGITNWQQQFPLPQAYSGANAWRIPLKGVLSDTPISAKTGLFRGAIALAINGVPIFNALNNRGEDAFLIGELDQWGGHCGRADDYHYHAAPLHLIAGASPATPLAVGLDGFPVYGLTEPDGSPVRALDAFNVIATIKTATTTMQPLRTHTLMAVCAARFRSSPNRSIRSRQQNLFAQPEPRCVVRRSPRFLKPARRLGVCSTSSAVRPTKWITPSKVPVTSSPSPTHPVPPEPKRTDCYANK